MVTVSVIIPTFNRSAFLKKAIDSVFAQTYRDFELIVVDDGSDDGTKQLIGEYGSRLRYIYQENKGPAAARNRGIQEAQGNCIAFLDSDDWWRCDKLAIQVQAIRENRECYISHTEEVWFKNGRRHNPKKKHAKYGGDIFEKCLPLCAVGMSTVIARRELFDREGLFDESLPCCEDYDLWLRVSPHCQFLFVDEPLTLKDGGRPDQLSSRFARCMDRFRIYSLKKVFDAGQLNEGQRQALLAELEKKCAIYGNGCIKHGRREEGLEYLNLVKQLRRP